MKTCSTIFSWIGGALTAFLSFSNVLGYIETDMAYLVIIPIVYTLIDLSVLLWRQHSINNGHKIACGICTIIFCGVVGGILTLCIPSDQLI